MTYGIYDNGEVIAKFVAPLTVKSNQPIFVSDTLSLKRFSSKRAAQRWEIESNVEPLSTDAQDLFVNLVTKGNTETVNIIMPQNYGVIKSRNASSGTPLGNGSINSSTVNVTSHTSGIMPKGTFIKFANHSKIYMTTSSLNGDGTVNIFPQLRVAVVNQNIFCLDNVIGNFLYDTDTIQGMVYTDGILMDLGTIKLVEQV